MPIIQKTVGNRPMMAVIDRVSGLGCVTDGFGSRLM
jgi:hypothetical protein